MINIHEYKQWKKEGRKIAMITCYDATFGRVVDESEIDMVLVGDSVAMVVHGYDSTLHATLPMMEMHVGAVARGVRKKLIVADMPFLSFRKGPRVALDAAEVLLRAGAHAVKLEGLRGHEETVRALVESGIPVMGHLGLTPQSVLQLGGHKVQGRLDEEAKKIEEEAYRLQDLGCFALVLECVPRGLGSRVSKTLEIPTIGSGAGADTDGQVLVLQDMLGVNPHFTPKFLRRYSSLHSICTDALNTYSQDTKQGRFPLEEESYG